jgi:hypothetical protein
LTEQLSTSKGVHVVEDKERVISFDHPDTLLGAPARAFTFAIAASIIGVATMSLSAHAQGAEPHGG